ncbi:ShlB/FhaC/HecB family hemolysin secretion/activation protein [Rhodopirellula sp. JC740]|uniref:ShlB/FhaC/HecB family hemolysin secretion/activation protein n=1 Tax=Rhodopirellula halodulae TaxID=2894198 RepID=A0ABS8NNR1_9BACT|nr:ShlB/FhaC/HecB family hemolysin secretion/activation protein [Rhodopirellula sp. JC740]MCC9645141.1 ShlB/FhaC/HecB family hemolysin secretion/activation protein [Rhodopirellula sp. JC740]
MSPTRVARQATIYFTGLLIGACVILASNLQAQNFERYAPRAATEANRLWLQNRDEDLPKQEALDLQGDDRILVDSLDAVCLVDSAEKIVQDKSIDDRWGIHHDFDACRSIIYGCGTERIIERYLGKPITLRQLNSMARDLILHYRRCKYPIVDVQIPEQRITGGTVHLVVIESRIGDIRVQPGCYYDAEELRRWIQCTRIGNRIYEPPIENDLLWMNQNPFRRMTVDFEKGSRPGTTDVIFECNDVRPMRGYIGADDTGVETLNYGRLFAGATFGNMFGRSGILGYQYTTDQEFRYLHAHSLSYSEAFSRHWSGNVFGSLANVAPKLGTGLNQDGQSWQIGGGFTRHLVFNRHEVTNLFVGFDFKSTDNNLEFDGSTVSDSAADLFQLRLNFDRILRGDEPEEYALLHTELLLGPGGGMSGPHSSQAFNTIRPGTSPDYVYGRMRVEDSRMIRRNYQLVSKFTGQVTSERLLFSEMLGIGGFDTLRGFDQRELNADHGWIANFEFGPKTHRWGCEHRPHILRCYGFVDMANGYLDEPIPGENAYDFAMSTGVGARFQIGDQLIARGDYGVGLVELDESSRSNRFHFGVTWIPGPRPR